FGSAVDIVTVDGHEALGLVASGNRYLDVRLEEDFEKGHVEGALNIPYYSSVTPQEKVKNPRFIEQVSSLFGKDEVFIVGCRSGVRAKRATVDLLDAVMKLLHSLLVSFCRVLETSSILQEATLHGRRAQ
ncbi:unnamed protein product, partial [Musa acuminata subsp. burmannicoides]